MIQSRETNATNLINFTCRFTLMESCWHADPEKRPNFKEIRQLLERMLEDNEVN